MNKTLTSIFETQGPQSFNISNQSFSEDNIFEEFIDSSFFHQVNFINQLKKLDIDGNLGYDSRPSMELKLRGPKQ